jgi:hypothetical protein
MLMIDGPRASFDPSVHLKVGSVQRGGDNEIRCPRPLGHPQDLVRVIAGRGSHQRSAEHSADDRVSRADNAILDAAGTGQGDRRDTT